MPKDFLTPGVAWILEHALEGPDAWFLAGESPLVPVEGVQFHVARDDARLARLAELIRFFAPNREVIEFPAWDCLPYDRAGPHKDIVAQRLSALSRLKALCSDSNLVVLTTVNAVMQRVAPPSLFDGRLLHLKKGSRIGTNDLQSFLTENGFLRVDTVGEPGEFAVRGGILDIYPSNAALPLRLDFFGDELERIRPFDPLTQISEGNCPEFTLMPVNELILDEASKGRFRTRYREIFATTGIGDPLYEAVSEGRLYQGMEHWLPLFHERMDTVFDYLPDTAVITLDPRFDEVRETRLETISDFYQARQQTPVIETKASADSGRYHALPPNSLYLSDAEVRDRLAQFSCGQLYEFAAPDTDEHVKVSLGGSPCMNFAEERALGSTAVYERLKREQRVAAGSGHQLVVTASTPGRRERLAGLLHEHNLTSVVSIDTWQEVKDLPKGAIAAIPLGNEHGFEIDGKLFISEQDLLGERIGRSGLQKRRADNFLREVSSISEGDLVVHMDHGIGRYEGLVTLDVTGAPHDCLKVVYHGGDRLFVPVENIDVLSRYGSDGAQIELDRLGQGQWQARRAQVKKRLLEIAKELMSVAAKRALHHVDPVQIPAGAYEDFCARFPYPETDDQLSAIAAVAEDLASGKPMDRLICGDVGFGKTEVALRAAFLVALSGQQVAIVAPTTLLARQHYRTFLERFAGYPVRIGMLSRLTSQRDATLVKDELAKGTLDIVIGTHALLAKSIAIPRLGLVIVDEEQHFGVKQKERMKQLRADVHVLTLTATPIPRTLQLAMSGLREMSLIATPPVDRLAVRTFVLPYDNVIIREAILREHNRGGQVFYVCPRIEDLQQLADGLDKLVPEVRLAVAHGRMSATELEAVMSGFYEGRFNVLLSTNIVESGLDIPTANTLVIHRADMFGLAQLYQLRGRVGRGKLRGYAYLTLPASRLLNKTSERRLHVMQTLDHLGAGFTLASHDMDIRGGGNLLGEEQSGHVREVGVELYQQMLEEAVATVKDEGFRSLDGEVTWSPQINVGTSVLIPDSYVSDLDVRLGLYRRLSELQNTPEVETFAAELIDRFGPIPEEVENLLEIMQIKQLCRHAAVAKVDAGPKGAVLSFHQDSFANPGGLIDFISKQVGTVQLRPDHKLVYRRGWPGARERLRGVRNLISQLAALVAA
ncbi:transcription-repair coupling factor (superfamily II helicase) [Limibacillus sp. MBR-115]